MATGGFARLTDPPTPQYKIPHERNQERLRQEREKWKASMTPEKWELEALICSLRMREVNIETIDGVQQATVSFGVKEKDKREEPELARGLRT